MAHGRFQAKYDRSSFNFLPVEFIITTAGLSLAERGRLFTNVIDAVARGDREAVKQWPFVGRVFWRQSTNRPYIQPSIIQAVFQKHGRRCRHCGSEDRIEIDHIVAFSKGGPSTIDNLQPLCKPCNRRKGAR